MNKFIVVEGTTENPGWVVYERIADQKFRPWSGTFTDKGEAVDLCDQLNWERSEGVGA